MDKKLTWLGWLRANRKIAMRALERYPIDFRPVDLVGAATNFLYRASDADGRLYGLRLAAPGWRTEDNLQAEILWLRALAVDTDIPVPEIVECADGEPYVRLTDERRGTERRVILMN